MKAHTNLRAVVSTPLQVNDSPGEKPLLGYLYQQTLLFPRLLGTMTESMLVFDVILTRKCDQELGLNIYEKVSKGGVFVSSTFAGSVAFEEGSIVPGDQILEVNGDNVAQSTQSEVVGLLKRSVGKIQLKMERPKRFEKEPDEQRSIIATLLTNIEHESFKLEQNYLFQRGSHEYDSSPNDCFVEIEKKSRQLGIKIAGGMSSPLGNVPIFIAMVESSSPAVKKLQIGDKILSVNGQSTENKTHEEVVWMIKVASPDSILLMKVRRGDEDVQKLVEYLTETSNTVNRMISSSLNIEISSPTSIKDTDSSDESSSIMTLSKADAARRLDIILDQGNDGMGFSIVGGIGSVHGDLPIFVKSIYSSGATAAEGRLRRGDRIVTVNGESLDGCTHEEAVALLKKWKGRVELGVIPT